MNTALGYLGNIPDGWNLVHLGRLTSEVRSLNSDCSETNALQFKMGSIISKSNGDSKYHPETLEGYTVVAPGDVVVNGLNLNYDLKSLRVGQVRENGVITSAYIIVRPEKIDADYFKYLLKGFDSIKTFHGMGKGIRLTLGYEELRRMYIPVPSPAEQSRIAAFLDERCGKIDEAIAKHKVLIEKLDEYRKAVITKAVTKGVRGEREMKESGVKWLPNIPFDWNIERTKFHFTNHKYVVGDKASEYERLALTLNGVIKRDKEDTDGLQPKEFGGYQILREGELVFKLIDLENVSTSRVGYSPYTGIVSPAYIILEKKKGIEPRYAEFYFLSLWMREIFNQIGDSGVRSSLNSKDLLELPIAFPSLAEQSEIVAFLDKKCAAIDSAKERHQQLITKLEEYKKSLIYNAVTGKIEC